MIDSSSSHLSMLSVQELTRRVKSYHPSADLALIERAYEFAERAHRGQLRKSGDPYFIHPASVAGLLTELRLDPASVCVGLLHDTVEDTSVSLADIEREFGVEIADLVDGVTKLTKIEYTSKADRQAENFRKMVVAMAKDIRVLLVKLCDRLDNMRTLGSMSDEAKERISRETMDIYAPLANRLGMARLKADLEDLAFQFLEPDLYRELSQKVAKSQRARDRYIEEVEKTLQARLAEHGFAGEVSGRAKHLYSIYRKLKAQDCDFEQVYDIIAFRVIVETVADCYAVLGVIHARWTPVPNRFKDYIALPKGNGYKSLHTTVIGPKRERIEIQTRTREMHEIAENGIAAHWKYKERGSGGLDPKDAEGFSWLRELMQVQKDLKDPAEFLESVKIDLFQEEIYVFTPKGDVHILPDGGTPVDFAYSIHSKIGDHCVGARVNGAMVPLRHALRSGDVVEILTSAAQSPNPDWLDFVKTSRAKSRLRSLMRAEQRDRSIKGGREMLEKALHGKGISLSRLLKNQEEQRNLHVLFKVQTTEELLMQIGFGKVKADAVALALVPPSAEGSPPSAPPSSIREGTIETLVRKVTGKDDAIRLSGIDDVLARYAKCCNPIRGDEIIGFITRGRGITVHRRDCPKAFDTDPERRVEIQWDQKAKVERPAHLRITTENRPGILATLGQAFEAKGINVGEAVCRASDDGRAVNFFTFRCGGVAELRGVMSVLRKIPGVVNVDRV